MSSGPVSSVAAATAPHAAAPSAPPGTAPVPRNAELVAARIARSKVPRLGSLRSAWECSRPANRPVAPTPPNLEALAVLSLIDLPGVSAPVNHLSQTQVRPSDPTRHEGRRCQPPPSGPPPPVPGFSSHHSTVVVPWYTCSQEQERPRGVSGSLGPSRYLIRRHRHGRLYPSSACHPGDPARRPPSRPPRPS